MLGHSTRIASSCDSIGVSTVGLRGVSKSRKFKWLVKVGVSKGVPPDLKRKPIIVCIIVTQ